MPDPKRGRPPLDPNDESVVVSVRFPAKQYDDLSQRAKDARADDLSDYIRRQLVRPKT